LPSSQPSSLPTSQPSSQLIYCHTLDICDKYKRYIFYSKIINL
jgi:hypothetical protein